MDSGTVTIVVLAVLFVGAAVGGWIHGGRDRPPGVVSRKQP